MLGAPPSAAAQADAPSTHPAAAEGVTAGEMAAVGELLDAMEAGLRAEDGEALGRLFHARGRLSDWRGRLARGPDRVAAAYREAFRAYRGTTPFRLDDGREVRLQRSPPVATEVRFTMDMVRELGDTAAVVDGDWRTNGRLAPTGAPLTGEASRQGEGRPPYAGAYRLVAVLSGERASIGLLHLDRYHATVEPGPAPGPEPGPEPEPPPGSEPDPPPRDPDAPAPAGEAPRPSSPVYFGTVSYWVSSPGDGSDGGDDDGGEDAAGRWRVELASAGDVPRRPSSPETRRIALWIYASLDAIQDGECTLVPPVSRDELRRR